MIPVSSNAVGEAALLGLLRPHARSPDLTIDAGRGWWPIIEACHRQLEARLPRYELLAVKQKYGVLAFQAFASPWTPGIHWTEADVRALDAIVEDARVHSARTCEVCGAAGQLHQVGSWLMTRCGRCLDGEGAVEVDEVTRT